MSAEHWLRRYGQGAGALNVSNSRLPLNIPMSILSDFIASIDRTSTVAPANTPPHGPHQRPMDHCPKELCLGHTWEQALDRAQNYGFKLFNPGSL